MGSVLVFSNSQFALATVSISEHVLAAPCTVLPVPAVTPLAILPTDDRPVLVAMLAASPPSMMEQQPRTTVARPTVVVVAVAAAVCC